VPTNRSEKSQPAPWRVPVAADEIGEAGRHFDLVADAETRASIARVAGLRDLPRLEANFEVMRSGAGGLHVAGQLSATVGQNCVVTLEPLANEVAADIDLRFMPQSASDRPSGETEGEEEPKNVKWDDPELLIGGVVDLGALATEFLILGLDPYPRKPGVVFEPPRDASPDAGPFAGLAGWTKGREGL
jgi:hypothetical protein